MDINRTCNRGDIPNMSDQQLLLSLWHKLYLKKEEIDSPDNLSQCARGFMQQLDFAKTQQMLSPNMYDRLLFRCDKLYSGVMDENDEKKGLNNYSVEAISLAKLQSTEIQKWHSSLRVNDVLTNVKVEKIEQNNDGKNTFLQKLSENWKTNKVKIPNIEMTSEINSNVISFTSNVMSTAEVVRPAPSCGLKRKCISPEVKESEQKPRDSGSFRTAKELLKVDNSKFGNKTAPESVASSESRSGMLKRGLGSRRGCVSRPFVSPIVSKDKDTSGNGNCNLPIEEDDRLKNIEPKMIELITNEIMDHGPPVTWDDIAGLEFAKKTIKEIVVLPILRPDIFTGLRSPPKGLLLFGPPGTGKTLIGKCIASQSKSTFFSISASSLTSKWIGDGEKMVRALFAVARCHQPAVIFIDEIDSLLTQRSDSEHESSRRMKTEILIQLDGAATNSEDKILVVGATNRPQELDEAARRRLVKRLYIPLPELEARKRIIVNLLRHHDHNLTDENITDIGNVTAGYSGADVTNLCKEAALGPIRCLSYEDIEKISPELVRPISYSDFLDAVKCVKASVSESDLVNYSEWNLKFGSNS